jgi:hypothetical protein
MISAILDIHTGIERGNVIIPTPSEETIDDPGRELRQCRCTTAMVESLRSGQDR